MVVLHIASIKNRPFCGVDVIVPKHIIEQQKIETVGLINISNVKCLGIEKQYEYDKRFNIIKLPDPFNKPDLVVFHQVYSPEYIFISKQLFKQNIPYIIVPHGSLTVEAQKQKRIKKMLGNILFGTFIKRAAAVQCLSQKEMNNTKKKASKFIGTNGCAIPNMKKHVFNSEKISFVYIGRLDSYIKGLDILLDAFQRIINSPYKDKCILNIYGPAYKGSYASLQEMIDKRSLGGVVEIHNPVIGDEKERVLLESDVFIQTSRSEAMPTGILEALSYGLPCLITSGTTLGDYVNHYNAGWVAETNSQDVFRCIVAAINEIQCLNEKSKGASTLIADVFSWENVTRTNIQNYRKFVNNGDK